MTSVRPKSFTYSTSVVWEKGVEAVLSAPGKPDIRVSTPPEFKGPEGNWTPESLFVAAVETCLLFTFLALARSRKLEFVSYRSQAEGLLEPVYGKQVVSRVKVRPTIAVKRAEDVDSARQIVGRMEPNCFISNSIDAEVIVEAEVVVAGA